MALVFQPGFIAAFDELIIAALCHQFERYRRKNLPAALFIHTAPGVVDFVDIDPCDQHRAQVCYQIFCLQVGVTN